MVAFFPLNYVYETYILNKFLKGFFCEKSLITAFLVLLYQNQKAYSCL